MKHLASIGILIIPLFVLTSITLVNAQAETRNNNTAIPPSTTTNTPSINNPFSVSIRDLIFESKSQSESMKISDIDKHQFEISWSGNGTVNGNIPVWESGTVWTTLKDDGYWYGEGQGLIITFDNKVAKYTFSAVGKKYEDGKLRHLGSVTFDTNGAEGGLSVLKNTIGVLADEIDQNGNATTKIWKLQR